MHASPLFLIYMSGVSSVTRMAQWPRNLTVLSALPTFLTNCHHSACPPAKKSVLAAIANYGRTLTTTASSRKAACWLQRECSATRTESDTSLRPAKEPLPNALRCRLKRLCYSPRSRIRRNSLTSQSLYDLVTKRRRTTRMLLWCVVFQSALRDVS